MTAPAAFPGARGYGDWRNDKRVRRLLASIADRLPPRVSIPAEHRWTRDTSQWGGFRVEALGILRRAYLTARYNAAVAAGDDDAALRLCRSVTVQEAIDEIYDAGFALPVTQDADGTWQVAA